MAEDYLPKDEPGLDIWFNNYGFKMDAHGAEHGFNEDEIKQAKDDAVTVHNIVAGGAVVEAFYREYVGFKRIMVYGAKTAATPVYPTLVVPVMPVVTVAMLAGIIQRMRSNVRRLKESANFNEAVAADFRVLPIVADAALPDEAKPVLKGRAMADSGADISFIRGKWDGLELEKQIGDSTEWTPVGRFFRSPAEDDSDSAVPDQPEKRRYRGRFLQGNKPVGVPSDIIEIVTIP
jgi:hypothetical protein